MIHSPSASRSTPLVGLGEGGAGGRVLPEMDIDVVAPAVLRRDLGDGAIDRASLGELRLNMNDGCLPSGLGPLALADIDIVAAAIDAIDDQVVAVIELVGEPARHDPAGDW